MSENTDIVDPPVDSGLAAGNPPPADPPPADTPADPPQPRMIPEHVFVREATNLRGRAREAETALEQANRTIQEQNELLQRMQNRGNGNDPPPPRQPPQQQPQLGADEVERRAFEMSFARDANSISEKAYQTYGTPWVESVNLLNALNLNSADFVGSVMDVVGREHTHEIMHAIAQDPDKAAALAGMSPVRRIAEITRIAEKMTKPTGAATAEPPKPPPARTVSRAPNPPPPVQSSNRQDKPRYHDSLSEAEFTEQFNEAMTRRSARR